MIRSWKLLAATVVLAAAPAVVSAGGTDEAAKTTVLDKLAQMDKRLNEAFRKIGEDMVGVKADALMAKRDLQNAQEKLDQLAKDMTQTRNDLIKMRLEMNDLKKGSTSSIRSLYPPADKASLDAITNRLGKIEKDMSRLTSPPRVALSPAPTGRLKLVNDYAEEMAFIVNGHRYIVAPHMIQVLEQVPAGAFTYAVESPTWGLRAHNTPVLAAGETFTITAH